MCECGYFSSYCFGCVRVCVCLFSKSEGIWDDDVLTAYRIVYRSERYRHGERKVGLKDIKTLMNNSKYAMQHLGTADVEEGKRASLELPSSHYEDYNEGGELTPEQQQEKEKTEKAINGYYTELTMKLIAASRQVKTHQTRNYTHTHTAHS